MRSLKPDLLFQQNLPFLLKNTWGQTACKILAMTSLILVGSAGTAIAQTASCVSPYNEVYGSNTPNQIWAVHGPTGAATQLTTSTFSAVTAINGMASDHNNFLVYYADVNSIYAWDVLNGDHELITNNFQSFLTQAGYTGRFVTLSSGGAAFYNGSLYVGVDGDTNQDFEIFQVNFQSGSNGRNIQSVTPLGIAAKSGGNITSSTREDWGDFIISNTGVILARSARRNVDPAERRFWNFDLNTNTFTLRTASTTPYQLAKSGDGRLWGLSNVNTVVELDSVGNLGSSKTMSFAATDAAECVTGQASVGDRVWNDVDGDGVQDAGELGISGVTIEIYRDLDKDGVLDTGEPLLATQTTNTSGNYNFTGLLPHDSATGAGHNDFIVRVNGGVPSGANPTTATTKTADLSSATQVFDTADFGYNILTISGKVWDDANNSANNTFTNINTGTEAGTNAGGLNAILVNTSGNVIATTPVAADGTYTFSNVTRNQNNVTIRLSTTAGTVGSAAPAASIPANWTNTSPLTTAAFNITTTNITGRDFGIEQLPTTNDVTAASQTNPTGTNRVQVSALSGTDPEDGTLGTGKTFKIVTLPTNGTLYYDGIAVTAGQNITNYDPTKLTIDPNDGTVTISFTYAAVDTGSKQDPTPATVTIPFTAPTYSISGTLYLDDDRNNTFNSEPTVQATITVKLLNASTSSVVATTTTTNGTYTFTDVTNGNYKVQVDTSDTDIPANTSLGTPNDVVTNVSSSNISNINFGFDIATNPISCDGNFYQIRVADSGSQLFKINRSVNQYTQTQIGNITPAVTLNALGYNKLDGFMYAIRSNTNQLYRIDRNGAVFLGTVTGLPSANYNTATIDLAGNYYVKQDTSNTTIYKINVSTRTATTITLNQSTNLGDMAFHPTDGAIYGLRDTTLYKIVISGTSGSVTTIGNTNISGSPAVGSVFFDASGSLYGYENAGTFYSINTTTGNATLVSTAPSTSQSDGASCPFTSPERVISTVKSVGTVSKVNKTTFDVPYTIVVTNTGTDTAPNTQITENLNLTFSTGSPTLTIPSSPTVTNGSCTANTGFNGKTDTKLLTGSNTLPIGASGTCTIKFTVRVVYPNQASVPSAAQNNTAYASSTSDSPNPGYTFASATPIPPPALLASAQSTVSATYPATSNVANVLLVKRITAINGDRNKNPNDNTPLNQFVDDTTSTRKDDDNDALWKSGYLVGAINAGKVKPGDEIEYTVYFLNADGANANSVRVCDRITANQDFKVNAYGTSKDMQLQLGTSTVLDLTRANDSNNSIDRTQFISAGGTVPTNCYLKATNDNGTLVIDITGNTGTGVPSLTTMPGSTAQGTPNDSYGFFRFITKVKP